MMKTSVAAIAALLLTGSAGSQTSPPRTSRPPTSLPQSGNYVVEPNHTMVLFSVNHLGFTTFYGRFTGASGALRLNAANPAASQVEISVPVGGEITTSARLNEELVSAQLLDAGKFTTMNFRSTRITRTGSNTADVVGDLTLHGVTRPVILKAMLHGFGKHPRESKIVVGFDATGQIRRSEFGVTYGVPVVSDEVDLTLSAEFDQPLP